MELQSTETMTAFLAATRLCDSESTKVREKTRDLVGAGEGSTEAALSIFTFVRDKVSFGVDYLDTKASETLDHGIGFCMTKTNLQMALLRAAGIPSRCHLVHLPKELNKPIMPKFFYDRMPDLMAHPWCECHLSGRWISCETLFDEPYYRGLIGRGHMTEEEIPSIDWDGKTDLILLTPWIQRDLGTFPSWDEAVEKAREFRGTLPPTSRLFGPLLFATCNRRIRDIRMS